MDSLISAISYLGDDEDFESNVIFVSNGETYEIIKENDIFSIYIKDENSEFEKVFEYDSIEEIVDEFQNENITYVSFNETKLYPIEFNRTIRKLLNTTPKRTTFGMKIYKSINKDIKYLLTI